MRVALFAAGEVGLEAAKVVRRRGKDVACLVLDAAGSAAVNDAIRRLFAPAVRVYECPSAPAESLLAELRQERLDLGVLAWWPYVIKRPLLELPRLGFLNFHPSYLPFNRGKSPNFWSLVEGTPFGVTLHWIDAGVDTGEIAYQRLIPATWEDTGGSLYARGHKEIVELFAEKLDEIWAGLAPRQRQGEAPGPIRRAAELHPASEIALDAPATARGLLNLIRARTFPPHPAAWFVEDGQTYEVRVEIRKVDR